MEFSGPFCDCKNRRYIISIDYKLNIDSNEQDKYQNTIRILLNERAVDFYEEASDEIKKEAQKFFVKYIKNKYKKFDHESPPSKDDG
ncbi:MAG: hypothetical protein AB7F64_09790 [Gammaproteobacteria bacterium]